MGVSISPTLLLWKLLLITIEDIFITSPIFFLSTATNWDIELNHFDFGTALCNEMSLFFINLFVEINVATNTMTVLNIPLWFLFFTFE